MAILGTDVQSLAQRKCGAGITIANQDCVDYINLALNSIGTDAQVIVTQSYPNATAGTWYAWPANALDVERVDDSTATTWGLNDSIGGWHTFNQQIRFAYDGSYDVAFLMLPTHIANITDPIAVHELFREALACYVAAQYKQNNEDDLGPTGSAAAFLAQFASQVSDVSTRIKGRRPKRAMVRDFWT